jgi:prolyl oligopeptidase
VSNARWAVVIGFASIGTIVGAARSVAAQPVAAQRPVTDRHPGLTVVDPYRWMESDASPELTQWLREQDASTSALVERIPGRDLLAERVRAQLRPDDAVRRVRRGGRRMFYVRPALDSVGPTLRQFDVDRQSESLLLAGRAVVQHEPSPDGRWLAISTADGDRVLIVDVRSAGVVDSLPDSAHFVGWSAGHQSVVYQGVQGRQRQLRARRLGTRSAPDSVLLVAGVGGAPSWEANDALRWLESQDRTSAALHIVRDGSIVSLRVRSSTRGWTTVASETAEVVESVWHDGSLYLLERGGLLRFDPRAARLDTVRSAKGRALQRIALAKDGLYLLEGTGGDASLWRWQRPGSAADSVPLPIVASGRAVFADAESPGVVLPLDRWLGDGGWYLVTPESSTRLSLTAAVPVDERFAVERRSIQSHDGARVPLTVIRRRDLPLDSIRMTWVMAYGAYGIPMTPLYQSLGAALVPFLEDGGVYVVAHVRGGGEFGREWHDQGRASAKPNGYRDLIAAVESLIAARLADPSRLVVEGSSGGGATVGMAGVTRPDLFRVVITHVPDANTLRLHATPDGPYMREEWGDIRTRQGVRALAAMDVTHHVARGTRYPAWWVTTGLRDESVPPWQPAKLIAHLQASGSERPAVLRVFPEEAHVLSPAAQVSLSIDLLAFALWQTGVVATLNSSEFS